MFKSALIRTIDASGSKTAGFLAVCTACLCGLVGALLSSVPDSFLHRLAMGRLASQTGAVPFHDALLAPAGLGASNALDPHFLANAVSFLVWSAIGPGAWVALCAVLCGCALFLCSCALSQGLPEKFSIAVALCLLGITAPLFITADRASPEFFAAVLLFAAFAVASLARSLENTSSKAAVLTLASAVMALCACACHPLAFPGLVACPLIASQGIVRKGAVGIANLAFGCLVGALAVGLALVLDPLASGAPYFLSAFQGELAFSSLPVLSSQSGAAAAGNIPALAACFALFSFFWMRNDDSSGTDGALFAALLSLAFYRSDFSAVLACAMPALLGREPSRLFSDLSKSHPVSARAIAVSAAFFASVPTGAILLSPAAALVEADPSTMPAFVAKAEEIGGAVANSPDTAGSFEWFGKNARPITGAFMDKQRLALARGVLEGDFDAIKTAAPSVAAIHAHRFGSDAWGLFGLLSHSKGSATLDGIPVAVFDMRAMEVGANKAKDTDVNERMLAELAGPARAPGGAWAARASFDIRKKQDAADASLSRSIPK